MATVVGDCPRVRISDQGGVSPHLLSLMRQEPAERHLGDVSSPGAVAPVTRAQMSGR